MTNDVIRPCPFCEGQAQGIELAMDAYALACSECGAIGPAKGGEDALTLAREAWNNRERGATLADPETCLLAVELEKVAGTLYRNELARRDAALILLFDSKTRHLAAVVHRLDPAGVKRLVQGFVGSLDRSPAGLIIPGR